MKSSFSLSKLATLAIFVLVVIAQLVEAPWKSEGGVIRSDVKGYYAYLPALFIHNDLKFEDVSVYENNNESTVWYNTSEDGIKYIKYTVGTAILYSPFFAIAHVYAKNSDYAPDGFSKPYRFALSISAAFYLFLALFFIRKVLLEYFKDNTVALTLIVIFLGTNAWNYYTYEAAYSHGYSIAVISIFIYGTIQWFKNPTIKWSIIVGAAFGMLVLIRAVDVIYILFPLLYGISSWKDSKEKLALFNQNKLKLATILLSAFLVFSPQLMYYKLISGNWLFYTYTNETFFFSHPRWLEAMFSFRNGWLIYSQLMFLSIIGLFFIKKRPIFSAIFVVLFVYTFVISSWWCWWYVGFGNRAFINLYPLLSIPLGAVISFLLGKKWWVKALALSFVFLGVFLSVFQSYQYKNGTIHWGYMSKKAYQEVFLKEKTTPLFNTYLEIPNGDLAIKGIDAVLKRKIDTIAVYRLDF